MRMLQLSFVPPSKRILLRFSGWRNSLLARKRLLKWFFAVLPACLVGQAVSVDLSPPIKVSDRTIALVQLTARPGAEPAALEWTLYGDAGKSLQMEAGEQAIAAKKKITCAAHPKGRTTCLVWGPNRNLIHNGIVAKIAFVGRPMHLRLGHFSAASEDGGSLTVHTSADASDENGALSFFSSFSVLAAGSLLLAVFLVVYFARRLSTRPSLNKRTRASGRTAALRSPAADPQRSSADKEAR